MEEWGARTLENAGDKAVLDVLENDPKAITTQIGLAAYIREEVGLDEVGSNGPPVAIGRGENNTEYPPRCCSIEGKFVSDDRYD